MQARFEAGTDIANIGAWDSALQRDILTDRSDNARLADVEKARLFLIRTGGDGGGPVDIYVNEEMPTKAMRRVRQVGQEHLLFVPSGRLMVGGAEDYRAANPQITGDGSVIEIPPGDYAISCFLTKDQEATSGAPTEDQLKAALGEEDYRYYRRSINAGLWGYLGLLLFPILWPFGGWMWTMGIMFPVVYVHIRIQESFRDRNERYQDVNAGQIRCGSRLPKKVSPPSCSPCESSMIAVH